MLSTSSSLLSQFINMFILGDPGAVSGGGKKSKRPRKKFGPSKVKSDEIVVLDFASPELFSRPLRLFPAPTNCPWVSEDETCYEKNVHF